MEFHQYVCKYIVSRLPRRRKTLNALAHDAERNLTGRRRRLPRFLAAACAATVAGAAFGNLAVRADASDANLWKSLFQGQVLLVGETHQREGSLHLMRRVVEMARATHACVTLAVEVAADQQGALDRVVAGVASVQAVAVWDALDFPAYRVFLDEMLQLSARAPCFRVVAADLPVEVPGLRDEAMAKAVIEASRTGAFVVGQFGALHTARGLRYSSAPEERNLADQLEAAALEVWILGEHWSKSCKGTLSGPQSATAKAYARDLGRIINGRILGGLLADAVQSLCLPVNQTR